MPYIEAVIDVNGEFIKKGLQEESEDYSCQLFRE